MLWRTLNGIIIFIIVLVLFAFILWMTVYLFEGYLEYSIPINDRNHIYELNIKQYQPQSGDIVLYSNFKKPQIGIKNLCYSNFTHVGIVYRTNNQFYVIEGNTHSGKEMFPLVPRTTWYIKNRGHVCIRPLIKPLSTDEQYRFNALVDHLLNTKNLDIAYNQNKKAEQLLLFEVTIPLFSNFFLKNALNYPKALQDNKYMLCTDFVAYIMQVIFQINNQTKTLHNTIKTQFFESYTELNTVFPDKYQNRLLFIKSL